MFARDNVRARRAAVDEIPIPEMTVDYADAFTVRLPGPDDRSAEAWVRSGLEEAPKPVRGVIRVAHGHLLRFRLLPATSPKQVSGWEVSEARHNVIYLAASSPILRGVIIARRPDQYSATLTTLLCYRRPLVARIVWSLVGPLHRRIAPVLLARAAMPSHG